MEEIRKARICIPVCVQHVHEIAPAVIRAAEFADMIELRIDCLTEAEANADDFRVAKLCEQSPCPVIVTFRPVEQGGQRELDQTTRITFWFQQRGNFCRGNGYFGDVELDIGERLERSGVIFSPWDWERIILSHHDFFAVPSDLEKTYERMTVTKAGILKIAVRAESITDCIPVLHLLNRARHDGREMIAIAMGNAGILTRILGPSRGGFLTYGSIEKGHANAPGQLSVSELRELYRIDNINLQTEIMGLVGEHVMHSVSPHVHNASFAASMVDAVYIPFEVRVLDDFVRRMVLPRTRELEWNLRGLSITAPYKSEVMKYLDWIDPIAVEIGAVNTVVIADEGLYGYNTDATAILVPLDGLIDLDGARVAVIGAGGAARSVLWSLRKAGAHVTVFARDVERGKVLARQFDAECTTLDGAVYGEFEIVVNATPLGTHGLNEGASAATASQLRGVKIAYDLVYNPIETRFMREAREAGCHTIGGLQMLVAQAAQQFKLWTGKVAPLDVMSNAARNALGN